MSKVTSILDHYPDYEATIGIEVHVQLQTKSKIFCNCANQITKEPNTNICNICAGHPGSLPVLNKQVVEFAIMAGLGTHSTITPLSMFARKHYFYPDLPKNYQITQSDLPICQDGTITIRLEDDSLKHIRLARIHMEEDAGKNLHMEESNESFVDLNRTGTPLLEIVTKPDIANSEEARSYLKQLHAIVRYLGICSGNMDEGAFRADTNISVKKKSASQLGTRVELKNINSFKFIGDAVDYEIQRQIELLENGGTVRQETRLWDTKAKKTIVMRSKEEAADYRYFNDPDLPLVEISPEWIARVKEQLPELPTEKFNRLTSKNGLSAYEADIIVDDPDLAHYYDKAAALNPSKQVVNWILRDVMGYLKEHKISILDCKVTPEKLAELIGLIEQGVINNRAAQEIFAHVAQTGKQPSALVKELGLEQVGSTDELDAIIKELVDSNAQQAAEYRSGKDKLFGFFVGLAMQKTKGKGNPKIIQELLKKYLS